MASFNDLRRQLADARARTAAATQAETSARSDLARLAAQQRELARTLDPRNATAVAARDRLRAEQARAESSLAAHASASAAARAAEARLATDLAALTDPRRAITELDDRTPFLLLPLRLETRFKTIAAPGGAAPQPQLWLRIFPDDCAIDTFDPDLSASEVENARAYWVAMWQAGGIEALERDALQMLASRHGAGRASWIVSQFIPLNLAQKPTKAHAGDVVLAIATDAPPSASEAAATVSYWRAAWLAGSDAAALALARRQFDAVVGAARASALIASFRPGNFDAAIPPGVSRASLVPQAAFVIYPAVTPKSSPWAHAPTVNVLPDRFVFIGYHGSDPPLVIVGQPVPSALVAGPDPGAQPGQQFALDADGNLVVPDALAWMSDFDRAVAVGMGMRIAITAAQARDGFDRVLVVGIRATVGEDTAKQELETLLAHHANGTTGLALLPQGTPTNNTDQASAGAAPSEAAVSAADPQAPLFTPTSDWQEKRDGQWLAEFLGIDGSVLAHVAGADGCDQRTERAMNTALWPATLGYWMQTMMAPVFSPAAVDWTREFFRAYVSGEGSVPALRIGAQPYGILPATAWSRMRWFAADAHALDANPLLPYLRALYPVLHAIDSDWRTRFADLSHVGKAGDPDEILLDVIGLHAGSVEWSQRYAESLDSAFNRLQLQGLAGFFATMALPAQLANARNLLRTLGYTGDATPPMLQRLFAGSHNLLTGGVVDDRPLSESLPIRGYVADGTNYIQWLIVAATASLDALYQQDGFIDDTPPAALLYLLLRHALQLGYHDAGVRLLETAGVYSAADAANARPDDPFLHIRDGVASSESRYELLYTPNRQVTGSATATLGDFIATQLGTPAFTYGLHDQLVALERLKDRPTASLERAFADHIDCCAYRLDAWLMGIVNCQLATMRNLADGREEAARTGIHLGAYGWLEDVRPSPAAQTPVTLADPDLAAVYASGAPLARDAANEGYVHAPSLNHAVAAAVLRNGYVSDASPQNQQTLAVNLTSERVRVALSLLDGIRAGQGLPDLLGYRFERGLHDRHGLAEVDKFIFKLRKAFPLRADRMASTKTEDDIPIDAIEARNVVDGLALVDSIRATGNAHYPFGRTDLPAATSAEAAAIDAEADALLQAYDAMADLALSEGVYQAVLGNYDRVAATLDAYARANFPPEPAVVRTPVHGIGLTHRVALHLDPAASHDVSPIAGLPMTPRARAEPALNRWLATMLPPLAHVGCMVSFREAATGNTRAREVTLDKLGLQPADLVALMGGQAVDATSELNSRVARFAVDHFTPRPDAPLSIRYLDKQSASYSVFELTALLRCLRRLTTQARPLRATDLALMNEAQATDDAVATFDSARLSAVQADLRSLRSDLAALQTHLAGPLADTAHGRDVILAGIDNFLSTVIAELARAATFAIAGAGWTFATDFRQGEHAAVRAQFAGVVQRWNDRLAQCEAVLTAEQALPTAASDQAHIDLLTKAEALVTASPTVPVPALASLRGHVTAKRDAFAHKRDALAKIADSPRVAIALLLSDARAALPLSGFDATPFSLDAQEDACVRFAEDALVAVTAVIAECDRRLAAAQSALDTFTAAAKATDRMSALEGAAKAMLGDDFRILPSFAANAAKMSELSNALQASRSGELFTFLTHPTDPAAAPLDFPVDTWLYGVARVRDNLCAWEQAVVLAGAMGRTEPELDAVQLPFVAGDRWVGLEFPSDLALDSDRLLYAAHFAVPFDAGAPQCGLLLDEWTETIPTDAVDTGIAFHYDRPSSEAPQTMLLVTPSEFRGAWQWNDLVDALNETLDFAKRRVIEPAHLDASPYAPFLPATVAASQARQLTIAADLALNNAVAAGT